MEEAVKQCSQFSLRMEVLEVKDPTQRYKCAQLL